MIKSAKNLVLPLPVLLAIHPLVITLGWTYYYLQVINMAQTKSRVNIPIAGIVFTMISSYCWISFGVHKRENLVIYSGLLGITASILIILLYFFYADP